MCKSDLKAKFESIFGKKDNLLYYFSPGRINLIGEHIDYNGGLVFPLAISIGTYAVLSVREDNIIKLYSEAFPSLGISIFQIEKNILKSSNWVDYPKGVISELLKAKYKLNKGFNAYIYGNLPNGASLSSSASLELLIAHILNDINDLKISDLDLVKYAVSAENNFVGVHCGIMDQFAVGMSKKYYAILLDCAQVKYEYVPFNLGDYQILIMNTNKRRELVTSAYNERLNECKKSLKIINKKYRKIKNLCELDVKELNAIYSILNDDILKKRVRHVVSEMDRVKKCAKALKDNNIKLVGELLGKSNESLQKDYEVTGKELDLIVKLAYESNLILGARMVGAGFADCAIALVHKNNINELIDYVGEQYEKESGNKADFIVAVSNNKTGLMEE